jgi:hypothetical protein
MARPEGFEPPTLCLEGRRSFQLSYGRIDCFHNPITELAALLLLLPEVLIPYCAQFCAHLAARSFPKLHPRRREPTDAARLDPALIPRGVSAMPCRLRILACNPTELQRFWD